MLGKIQVLVNNIFRRIKKLYASLVIKIQKSPLRSFYVVIGVLVLLIILSSLLRTPKKAANVKSVQTKSVSLYSIGSVPKVQVQAQIKKSGVVKVVALTGGVVQSVNFHEGNAVEKGSTLFNLSSNYQGGSASTVQRQLAQNQYQSAVDTYGTQKSLISDQRVIATSSAQTASDLRNISSQSLGTTRDLSSVNQSLLDSVNSQLDQLKANPQADPAMIASLQAQKAQLLQATLQTQSTLRTAEYQSANDKPPAQISDLQKSTTLKQLDLQEKTLQVNKEAARLQLQLAQVSEALMYPSSPVTGVVQRVFVQEGDVVSPGQELAVVVQDESADPVTAIAYVPKNIAEKVSKIEPSILKIGNKTYPEYPTFVSTDAVQGNSYAVYYDVPQDLSSKTTEKGYIDISIPVGYPDTTSTAVYVPIDAIYQTSDTAYLFIREKNKAISKKVELGEVYGTYVEVIKGLHDGDQVILTRSVIENDPVQIAE